MTSFALAMVSHFAVGGARSHNPHYEGYVDTVIYGCWPKSVFDRVGNFDLRHQVRESQPVLVR